MSETKAIIEFKDIVLNLLEESCEEFRSNAYDKIFATDHTLELTRKNWMLQEPPGYVSYATFSVKRYDFDDEDEYFELTLYCMAGFQPVEVKKRFTADQNQWKSLTEEEIETILVPEIKKWWQGKANEIPYGGVFDYWIETILTVNLKLDACPPYSEKYYTLPDEKRLNVWREKLGAYIRNKEYINYSGSNADDKQRLSEALMMIDELGIEAVRDFFYYLKDQLRTKFDAEYGLRGFHESMVRLYTEYNAKPSPSEKESKDVYDAFALLLELQGPKIIPESYFAPVLEALDRNGYPFEVPYIHDIKEVGDIIKSRLDGWIKERTAPERCVRELTVVIRQNPIGPMMMKINDTEYRENMNAYLVSSTSHLTESVIRQMVTDCTELIETNQHIFKEKVSLTLSISAFDIPRTHYTLDTFDIKKEPEYQEWLERTKTQLSSKEFDALGFPAAKSDANDMIELLENTDADTAIAYLEFLTKYIKKNKGNIDTQNLFHALALYFQTLEDQRSPGEGTVQDVRVALAQFVLAHKKDAYLKDADKYLNQACRAGNKYALTYRKDYKEWLDGDFWYGLNLASEDVVKMMKTKPKKGLRYIDQSKGSDIVVALTDESKETYQEVLNFLTAAVPQAAKKAEKSGEYHTVTILFPEKPTFPEVPLHKDEVFEWSDEEDWELRIPRSCELAFFHRIMQWPELHANVKSYADTLLNAEYRINTDDEYVSLAALPVVTALVMNDKKYFAYAKKYALKADTEHEAVQISLIPAIIRKYGTAGEAAEIIELLIKSYQNGFEYTDQNPALEGFR